MKIDVLLATYNRSALLRRAIDSFLAAEEPSGVQSRLIVIDNNSRDDTQQVAQPYAVLHPDRIILLFEGRQGKFHALNAGIAHSDADVVAMFDDDERLMPNWLSVIARNFADPAVDFIGGEVRPDWQSPAPDWLPTGYTGVIGVIKHGTVRRPYGKAGVDAMLTGGNTAIRRDVLDRCGPYRGDFMYAEDRFMDLQLKRIGAVGYYEPDLVVFHHVPQSRLTKPYYRHWVFTEGRTIAKEDRVGDASARRVLGAPPWMWARACASLAGLATSLGRGQQRRRFNTELQLIEFWGYLTVSLLRLPDRYRDRTAFELNAQSGPAQSGS